jgi:8-oxo-dGTP pyrophosphatase MutT (NUDIX family)
MRVEETAGGGDDGRQTGAPGRSVPRRARAKRETSAGGIVLRCTDDGPRFLLILDGYGNWGFPKGHIDEGEIPDVAARREILEETNLGDLILRAPLGMIDWYFRFKGRLIHKYCHYYLFESAEGCPEPQVEEGITACRWFSLDEAIETISYDNAKAMLRSAARLVPQFCGRSD